MRGVPEHVTLVVLRPCDLALTVRKVLTLGTVPRVPTLQVIYS